MIYCHFKLWDILWKSILSSTSVLTLSLCRFLSLSFAFTCHYAKTVYAKSIAMFFLTLIGMKSSSLALCCSHPILVSVYHLRAFHLKTIYHLLVCQLGRIHIVSYPIVSDHAAGFGLNVRSLYGCDVSRSDLIENLLTLDMFCLHFIFLQWYYARRHSFWYVGFELTRLGSAQ